MYEPLWEDLYHDLKKKGLKIKSIWIADPVTLGSSAALNEHLLHDYGSSSLAPSDPISHNLTPLQQHP